MEPGSVPGRSSLSIDVLAMCHPGDRHERGGFVDLIEDAVLAPPEPVEILEALEFFRPERSRVVGQGENQGVGAFENFSG